VNFVENYSETNSLVHFVVNCFVTVLLSKPFSDGV
jgi:hypothetical protein